MRGQIYLSSETFVKQMQSLVEDRSGLAKILRSHSQALGLAARDDYATHHSRDEAMAQIAWHFSGYYSKRETDRKAS